MRILAIRGRNLASLARSFEVDLVHSLLGGVGLFAITGPVGAGKSTLLDALCLALFDCTPRLSGRGGVLVGDDGEARGDWLRSTDPRSLLRRDAAEGHAEVDFTGRDGVCYRARWAVRRARRRPDGRVQDQEMSLVDLERNVLVAGGRKTEVLAAIEARLGLDFRQFCRSVLLAQGEFAAFLRATADERARLLENLTGADVYRKLSRAAHERRRQGEAHVQVLRAQLELQAPLEAADRAALEQQALRLAHEHEVCKVGIDLASRYVTWHAAAERHRQNESQVTVALQQAIAADAAATARRERLARLQRALPVVPRWEVAEQGREAAQRAREAAVVAVGDRTEHAAVAQRCTLALAQGLRTAFARGSNGSLAVPPLVRDLAQWEPLLLQWQNVEQRAAAIAASLPRLLAAVDAAKAGLATVHAAAAVAEQERERAAVAVEVARHATQAPELLGVAEQRSELRARRVAVAKLRELAQVWQSTAVQCRDAAVHVDSLGAAGVPLARVAADARQQHDAAALRVAAARRTQAQLRTHHDLAARRSELVAGEPCPLCGATEHPSAGGTDDADREATERALAAAEHHHDEAQRLAVTAAAEHRSSERDLVAARRAADAASKALAVALAAFRSRVDGDAEAWVCDSPELAMQLAALRLDAVEAAERDMHQNEAAAAAAARAFDVAVQAGVAAEQVSRKAREKVQAEQQQHRDAVARAESTRADGERLLSATAELQGALVAACEGLPGGADALLHLGAERVPKLRSLHGLYREQVDAAAAAESATERSVALEAAELRAAADETAAQQALARALAVAEVSREDVAAAVHMGIDAMPDEARELQALADEVTAKRAVLRERAAQRREHEAHDRPELDAADAALALEQARRARDEVEKRHVDAQSQLRADDAVRRQRAEIAPRLAEAEQALAVWRALDDLIGSSGGDAFVVFAQSLTLDLLLVEANRRLAELARRYRLQKNPGGEMDFVVVDLDLGGSRRGLQSLSGGETFLVSLALALALATLAAPRSRVETLFLDEGFGTLDAQNLEAALGALDTLQATGCQIGVISHVDGIAERIGAIVEVRPEGGGQSRVRARLA
ncbi:MAG: AAA family ATPase [Planctomycetota bacterium]